jgi:hypothetical protein
MAPRPVKDTKLDISRILSPPDPVIDSFAQGHTNGFKSTASAFGGNSQQPLPMSPPISPHISTDAPRTPPGQAIKDPVLYPTEDVSTSGVPQPPLFAPAEIEDHRQAINDHVRAQSSGTFGSTSPPKTADYELWLSFTCKIMGHCLANRRRWLEDNRALLKSDQQASAGASSGAGSIAGRHRYHAIMPAKPAIAKPPRAQRADRVSKSQPAPRSIRASNGTVVASTATHRPSPVRPSGGVSATPEPSRRSVAPNREDKDFNALPDYCPPLQSLYDSDKKNLKVDWKGQPIDLSNDPHAHLLLPEEVALAGNLRLDCATYLTSKRRIFESRLSCLRKGKEFRKTDAQQACKIDVNKASKLWTAFDRVDWLKAHWVQKFL